MRDDNADLRLRAYGHKVGLISDMQYERLVEKERLIEEIKTILRSIYIKEYNTDAYTLLKRPEIKIEDLMKYLPETQADILAQVEINVKYEGYINKTIKEAEKMLKNENKKIPLDIDYDIISNLASEARQKLKKVRPLSLGQALRISGVNPSDISILSVYLRKQYPNE